MANCETYTFSPT